MSHDRLRQSGNMEWEVLEGDGSAAAAHRLTVEHFLCTASGKRASHSACLSISCQPAIKEEKFPGRGCHCV